jgi:hypothetical protein
MTKRIHRFLAVLLVAAASLLPGPGSLTSQQPEKKVAPTAVEIAKEWRYPLPPGVIIVPDGLKPLKSEAFCIEKYTVKADYPEVWNHFAAKSGSDARFKDKMIWGLMDKLKGPDKGHLMVYDIGQEAHFGQNTESRTVHVEIRRGEKGHVHVCVVVGVR